MPGSDRMHNLPPVANDDSLPLQRARMFIDEHFYLPVNLEQISRAANFSRYHFIRLFRQAFHQTPHQYLTHKRIEKAKQLLAESDLTVTDVCLAVGFESLGSFSTLFRKAVGQSPTVYRARMSERRRCPQKFIPACFLMMNGLASAA